MTDKRREIGNIGEIEAVHYLEKKGYNILEKRFRTRFGEIDIIAKNKNRIVFIEVKTRREGFSYPPQVAVHEVKQRRIYRLALEYLRRKKLDNIHCGFEVISVILSKDSRPLNIEHIQDAFELV